MNNLSCNVSDDINLYDTHILNSIYIHTYIYHMMFRILNLIYYGNSYIIVLYIKANFQTANISKNLHAINKRISTRIKFFR